MAEIRPGERRPRQRLIRRHLVQVFQNGREILRRLDIGLQSSSFAVNHIDVHCRGGEQNGHCRPICPCGSGKDRPHAKHLDVFQQRLGGLVAAGGRRVGGLVEDAPPCGEERRAGVGLQGGSLVNVFNLPAEACGLEREPEAVDVACGVGEALGRNVARRPDERRRGRLLHQQPRIGEDGTALDVQHVSGLDVAVQKVVALERGEALRKRQGEPDAVFQRQRLLAIYHAGKRFRAIVRRSFRTSEFVVSEIHHRVEAPFRLHKLPHADKPILMGNGPVELRPPQFTGIAFAAYGFAAADLHGRSFTAGPCGKIDRSVCAAPYLPFQSPGSALQDVLNGGSCKTR